MIGKLKNTRILLIEDSKESAYLTKFILNKEGASVDWYSNPIMALEDLKRITTPTYNVVLTDIGLPSISGYEFCERARRNSIIADTPFIALSGYEISPARSKSAGFKASFTKPMKPSYLIEQIQNLNSPTK